MPEPDTQHKVDSAAPIADGAPVYETVGWSLGGAAAAVLTRAALQPVIGGELPYITAFPIVLLVTLAAGAIAGLTCLLLSFAALVYFLVDPAGAFRMAPGQDVGLVVATIVSLLLIGIGTTHRRLRLQSKGDAGQLRKLAESLRESEERFRRLTELSPDAMFVICDGKVVYLNQASIRLLRAKDENQIYGHSPLEVIDPAHRVQLETRVRRALATGEINPPTEYRVRRFDGSTMMIEATSSLSPWQGRPAVQIIARDITERKATEEQLRNQQRDLEDLLEYAPVPIHCVDGEGRITRANHAELDMLGYTAEEYIGRPVRELHADPAVADHIVERLRKGETLCRLETEVRCKDGTLRRVLLDANARTRDGELVYGRCFMLDVTEQHRAEQDLKSALDRFRLCLTATRDVMYDWDLDKPEIHWNEALRTLVADAESPLATSYEWWQSRVHADDLERVERSLSQALAGSDDQWTCHYRFRRNDGVYVAVHDRAAIARDESGTATRMVGAMVDVTDRQRWEQELARRAGELERSNRELEDFARIISHDLKEPLRGITDYAGYLRSDYAEVLDEQGRDLVETLQYLGGRMEQLLDALLEYSRVGRMELRVMKVDLSHVLADALIDLRSRLDHEHAQVVVTSSLPECWCDPVLAGQVFTNLIVNGLKYNVREDKRIEIGCVEQEDGEQAIFVRDNGIGIDERQFGDIFEMFRRLHARERFGGGSGSGLSIVKKIVERHGGRVWVQSRIGEGSTFYFTFGPGRPDEPPEIETRGLKQDAAHHEHTE